MATAAATSAAASWASGSTLLASGVSPGASPLRLREFQLRGEPPSPLSDHVASASRYLLSGAHGVGGAYSRLPGSLASAHSALSGSMRSPGVMGGVMGGPVGYGANYGKAQGAREGGKGSHVALSKQQTRELLDEIRMRRKQTRKVQFGNGAANSLAGLVGPIGGARARGRRLSNGSDTFSIATATTTLERLDQQAL